MFDFSFNLHNYSYSDPPLIESAPVSQVVLEGNNLTLHCNASGNPTPTSPGLKKTVHQCYIKELHTALWT